MSGLKSLFISLTDKKITQILPMLCPALCHSGSDAGGIAHFKPLTSFITPNNFSLSQTAHLFLLKRASQFPHRAAGDHGFNLLSSLHIKRMGGSSLSRLCGLVKSLISRRGLKLNKSQITSVTLIFHILQSEPLLLGSIVRRAWRAAPLFH